MVEPAWMTAKRKAESGGVQGPPPGGPSDADRLLSSMQPPPPPPGAGGAPAGGAPGLQQPSATTVGDPPMPPYVFLDAICTQNMWVQEWTLFAGPPGPGGEEMFVWKVKITLPNNAGESEYLPRRLLSSKYEAQHDAAHHVLKELGIA
jgi:hypothetical protein